MSFGNSRRVESNQAGLHERLDAHVQRHLTLAFRKPIAAFNKAAFDIANARVQQHRGPLILDACCGVGGSSIYLAQKYPDALVIGVDKSAHRLGKAQDLPTNVCLVQADLDDFWRLALWANWQVSQQYILYPNPWPKAAHLGRRWHGTAVFPFILALGGELTVRSNWNVYVREFARAMQLAGIETEVCEYSAAEAMTPFEAKYWGSGQQSWQLQCELPEAQVMRLREQTLLQANVLAE